jgi:N6-adenosine-specific RNA methylase IME4
VNRAYKKLVTLRQAEQIEQELPVLPGGKFRVIVADPPWSYDHRAEDATHRAANPYPSMTIDKIKALPVGDLAHEDCILWLWATNVHMRQAFDVAEAWGFECTTILTWAKDRMGTGDWPRGQIEHCLMCVRGKPVITLTNQTTVLHAPLREHSRKPDEFYALVESLCPGSKVELFARQTREGWSAHGNDTNKI